MQEGKVSARRIAVPLVVIAALLGTAWWLHDPRPDPVTTTARPSTAPVDARVVDIVPPKPKSVTGLQFSTAGYGMAPLGSECVPEDENYDFAFDGRLLVAKICETENGPELVRHTYWGQVTVAESDAIVLAAASVEPTGGDDVPCKSGRPFRWASIMKDVGAGELTRFTFTDSAFKCSNRNNGFSNDLEPLLTALRAARSSLVRESKKPISPDAGSGGMVNPEAGVTITVSGANDTPIGSTCMAGSMTYTFSAPSADDRSLSWEVCQFNRSFKPNWTRLHWYERVLTQAEYDGLLDKLRHVAASTKTTCEAKHVAISLTAATKTKVDLFVDEAHACRQSADRRAVTGLAPLVEMLHALAKDFTSDHVQDENE